MKVLECGPGNKPCGKRCVPQKYKCKGEGDEATAKVDVTEEVDKKSGASSEFEEITPEEYAQARKDMAGDDDVLGDDVKNVFKASNILLAISAGLTVAAIISDNGTGKNADMTSALYGASVAAAGLSVVAEVAGVIAADKKLKKHRDTSLGLSKKFSKMRDGLGAFEDSIAELKGQTEGEDDQPVRAEFLVKSDNPDAVMKAYKFVNKNRENAPFYTYKTTPDGVMVQYDEFDNWK